MYKSFQLWSLIIFYFNNFTFVDKATNVNNNKSFISFVFKLPFFCFEWTTLTNENRKFPYLPFLSFERVYGGKLSVEKLVERYETKPFFKRVCTIALFTTPQTIVCGGSPMSFWIFYSKSGRPLMVILLLEYKDENKYIEFHKPHHKTFEISEGISAVDFPASNFLSLQNMEISVRALDHGGDDFL